MMLTLLVAAWAAFAWSINRRWQLLKVGRSENRTDHIGTRRRPVSHADPDLRAAPRLVACQSLTVSPAGIADTDPLS